VYLLWAGGRIGPPLQNVSSGGLRAGGEDGSNGQANCGKPNGSNDYEKIKTVRCRRSALSTTASIYLSDKTVVLQRPGVKSGSVAQVFNLCLHRLETGATAGLLWRGLLLRLDGSFDNRQSFAQVGRPAATPTRPSPKTSPATGPAPPASPWTWAPTNSSTRVGKLFETLGALYSGFPVWATSPGDSFKQHSLEAGLEHTIAPWKQIWSN
jgi:hypothetical protein